MLKVVHRTVPLEMEGRINKLIADLEEERNRNADSEDAIIELGELFAEQDDAIIELAEMIGG